MPRWVHLLAVAVAVLFAGIAQAQTYSCSAARPPNYTQTYSSVSNASTLLNVTVTCRRRGNGPALSINYTLTPDNGLYAVGAQNRASRAGQYINYDLYADGSCIAPWSGAGTITLPGAGRNARVSQTLTYYGCVPASQPVLPASRELHGYGQYDPGGHQSYCHNNRCESANIQHHRKSQCCLCAFNVTRIG